MLLFLIAIWFAILFLYNFYWKRKNLPPGPIPIPIFGNAIEIFSNEPGYEAYKKWHKKYGPVQTIWMGETPYIVVSDYQLIRQTFIKDGINYVDRHYTASLNTSRGGMCGIMFAEGDAWRDQRQFAINVLVRLGMGNDLMQEKILIDLQNLIDRINNALKNRMTIYDITSSIDLTIGSIILNILFGKRIQEDTISIFEYSTIRNCSLNFLKINGHPFMQIVKPYFGLAKYIPWLGTKYHIIKKSISTINNFIQKQIDTIESKLNVDDTPSSYVEAFLQEKILREAQNNVGSFTNRQLVSACFDFWLTGQDSTSNTISWGILYILQSPEVQKNIHEELDSVIGNERFIIFDDHSNLNYLCAVLNEIQRVTNLLPLNVRRVTANDVNINGHKIPKGSVIVPQISVVLSDENAQRLSTLIGSCAQMVVTTTCRCLGGEKALVFPNPHKFDPTRFLDEKGKLIKIEEFIPFSVGKRKCIGENLARTILFLVVANLFNQFEISTVENMEPVVEKTFGITVSPPNFLCKIKKRF